MADGLAAEARDAVRRAVGDASGLTVKGQIRQAARNLGYAADSWRVREAWYGRAGHWTPAALEDLRARASVYREGERVRPAADRPRGAAGRHALARHLGAVRDCMAQIERHLAEIEAEMARLPSASADASDGGPGFDA